VCVCVCLCARVCCFCPLANACVARGCGGRGRRGEAPGAPVRACMCSGGREKRREFGRQEYGRDVLAGKKPVSREMARPVWLQLRDRTARPTRPRTHAHAHTHRRICKGIHAHIHLRTRVCTVPCAHRGVCWWSWPASFRSYWADLVSPPEAVFSVVSPLTGDVPPFACAFSRGAWGCANAIGHVRVGDLLRSGVCEWVVSVPACVRTRVLTV
jgi:hypothetical protein